MLSDDRQPVLLVLLTNVCLLWVTFIPIAGILDPWGNIPLSWFPGYLNLLNGLVTTTVIPIGLGFGLLRTWQKAQRPILFGIGAGFLFGMWLDTVMLVLPYIGAYPNLIGLIIGSAWSGAVNNGPYFLWGIFLTNAVLWPISFSVFMACLPKSELGEADTDPNVFDEPHLRGEPRRADPSEESAQQDLSPERHADDGSAAQIEHSVWDEPGISPALAGPAPPDAATYGKWLDAGRERVGWAQTWAVTVGVALLAGPWAILGAVWGSGQSWYQLLLVILFGPAAEEVMKMAAALYVVEKRPYWFSSRLQIALCALAGGLAFAAIENVIYLEVYIPNPSAGLVQWRWTICTGLHTACSFIAGMGLMRIWQDAWKRRARPDLTVGYPYLVTAILIHGSYNAFAVYLSLSDYQF